MTAAGTREGSARHWVVVPCYNEAAGIGATIDALAAQTAGDFRLVFVDNASTDDTAGAIQWHVEQHPHLEVEIVQEPEKGTGCAADTGFRHAIANGAEIVFRTDADCLPHPHWFARLRKAMIDHGYEAAAGRLKIRTDDVDLSFVQLSLSRLGIFLVPRIGPFLKSNRGPGYKMKYVMMPGPNVAMRAAAYEQCGGYPRRSFDVAFLDKEIANSLRRETDRIGYVRGAVVLYSERRTAAYGFLGTLRWLRSRGGVKGGTDVR